MRPPSKLPDGVSLETAQVEVGLQDQAMRKTVSVAGFKMTRFPITVGEYRECVRAGGCTVPGWKSSACANEKLGLLGKTYVSKPGPSDHYPVTCVTPSQASAYCAWVGGKLPTLRQWLYGARGTDVRRYSWGDSRPTCTQHMAALAYLGQKACCSGKDACTAESLLSVGQHADGASPGGIEDVLTSSAELIGTSADAALPGCPSSAAGCLVYSIDPAAIDAIRQVERKPDKQSLDALPTWTFRCSWSE